MAAIKTSTVTLNNSTDTGVPLPAAGQNFRVREDGGGASTRFTVKAPTSGDTAITFGAGEPWIRARLGGFKNAETVGFVKLLDAASATFQVEVW